MKSGTSDDFCARDLIFSEKMDDAEAGAARRIRGIVRVEALPVGYVHPVAAQRYFVAACHTVVERTAEAMHEVVDITTGGEVLRIKQNGRVHIQRE